MASRSPINVQTVTPAEQMRNLLRAMADFIALYETIDEKLMAREIALEGKLFSGERLLAEQLAKIKIMLADFQSIMTEAGAARWRIAAENALREGGQHLATIYDASAEITKSLQDGCLQLEEIAKQTIKGISEATNSFHAAVFKEAAVKGCDQVKEVSLAGIKRINKLVKSFHWKGLIISLVLTFVVVFVTGLYLNDEWPWEIHQQASKERTAGQTLLTAWARLTPAEQQDIINAGKNH